MRLTTTFFTLSLALLWSACAFNGPSRTEILWDTWGVPHIYGEDAEGLHYAFGWAQMANHGDLILRLYGQARGRAAEYWGEVYLDDDRFVRTMGVPERAQVWYETQNPAFRTYLDAFARGMNDYAEAHADLIDDEVEVVLPVVPGDLLAHTQRAIHLTFVGGGALQVARRWGAPGSNAWALAPSRTVDGHAMLRANPHLPWSDLFTWFEAHLTGPGIDAYGAALVGMPTLAIAFNDYLGWTHTVNTFDGVDLYELTLVEDGYAWDGGVQAFETDTATLRIKQEDGTMREEALTIRRSVHGPVLAQRQGQALAVRIAGLDQPDLTDQYWQMMRATNLEAFEAALRRLQMPMFNTIYADRDGHILYHFGGRNPKRASGDWAYWQGLIPGDTSATLWTETHPYDALPRLVDPPSGWVQNANDPPWTSTFPMALDPDDFPSYMAPRHMAFRPQRSVRMVAEDEQISFDELLAYKHSTRMEMADRLLDDLIPAARQHGGALAQKAADVLEQWDRNADAESRGGVLFAAWVQAAGRGIFETPWREDDPRATPDGLRDPEAAVAALEAAARQVQDNYDALDVPWGEVYRLRYAGHDLPANGGPGGLGIFRVLGFAPDEDHRFRAAFGDSYVALVEFSDPVRARVLLGYGNATQPHSPHRGDQLDLFSRKELRPAWRTRAEIEAHLEKKEVLHGGEPGH